MKKSLLPILLLVSILTTGQTKKEKDQDAIKNMCGCYQVTFNFAETFNYSEDSLYIASKSKSETAIEWVQLVEENENIVSMQHLLQVGTPERPYIIKHWRQDWLFENTNFYIFNTAMFCS